MIIWHNGTYKNDDAFGFAITDRIRYGDGVFDTILGVEGQPIAATPHIERLYTHAQIMHIPIPFAPEEITQAMRDVLGANRLTIGCAVINILASRGAAPRGLIPPNTAESEIIITASQKPETTAPVHAIIAQTVRRNEGSALSRMKTCNYGDSILALLEAKEQGGNEAILCNNQGRIACTSAGNIYFMINGVLYTPPLQDGAMAGIIRHFLLNQGKAIEKSLTPGDASAAEGIFLSNSIRGLIPVQSLNGKTLPLANSGLDAHFHHRIFIE